MLERGEECDGTTVATPPGRNQAVDDVTLRLTLKNGKERRPVGVPLWLPSDSQCRYCRALPHVERMIWTIMHR